MDEFTLIKSFIKVVESGSFSAAARDQSSVSSVARQVKALEDELGARLLNRSTRSLSLTDTGRRFYERVTMIATDLKKAKMEVSSLQEEVRGPLRVSLRITAGMSVVMPALPKFLEQYPELELDLSLTDERRDLIANNIDVALWLGPLPDMDIVARRLSPGRRVVFGTPGYFERHGMPRVPQDLRKHNCLVYTAPSYRTRWAFTRDGQVEEVEVHGSVRTDNGLLLHAAAFAGIGVTTAYEWGARHHLAAGRIIQVLDGYDFNSRPGDADLYAVFPSSRGLSRKVRVFVDFLLDTFKEAPGA